MLEIRGIILTLLMSPHCSMAASCCRRSRSDFLGTKSAKGSLEAMLTENA
jgi:hypothetical protein